MNSDFKEKIPAWTGVKGGGEYNETERVVNINSVEALSQFIGYVKYAYSYYPVDSKKNKDERRDIRVYFRGQTKHYTDSEGVCLFPSIFRNIESLEEAKERFRELENFTQNNEQLFMNKGTYNYAYTAVLQQYGLSTNWLDIVDNIWSALWFASHSLEQKEQNEPLETIQPQEYNESQEEYSYVYVMAFEKLNPTQHFFLKKENESTDTIAAEVIDLRMAIPSMYLRPHTQHALMVRKETTWPDVSNLSMGKLNFMDHLVATLCIKTKDILDWLGDSRLLSARYLFPHPDFDEGYRVLCREMEKVKELKPYLGKLARFYDEK